MDKDAMCMYLSRIPTHTHSGISFSDEKEDNIAISNNMDAPWWHYAKWNK